ncbi:MAG: hypothetical protein L0Z62_28515 [Gemmataceae bacterium]|nr:hypothetical protein [Gemmataceae bacterium]
MTHSSRDRSASAALNPADVAAYLASAGWKQSDYRPGHSSTWRTTFEGEPVELMLPLNRHYQDYVLRMDEAVLLIAAVEKRLEQEVLADLQTAGADVIRVRFRHAEATDGTIPLD